MGHRIDTFPICDVDDGETHEMSWIARDAHKITVASLPYPILDYTYLDLSKVYQ